MRQGFGQNAPHVTAAQITGTLGEPLSLLPSPVLLADPRCSVAGKPIYLLATQRDLDAMTSEYRARLVPIEVSNLPTFIGGSGPPELFEISPGAAK